MFEASLSAYALSSSPSWKCKEEIDEAVEALSSGIVSAFHDACPLQDQRKKKTFKFTEEIREKVKEKRRIRREKSIAASEDDWTLVREKTIQINRLGNDIKKIQRRQKKS